MSFLYGIILLVLSNLDRLDFNLSLHPALIFKHYMALS